MIAFIGGGYATQYFIQAAKEKGYKTILFDKNHDCPSKGIADKYYYVDSAADYYPILRDLHEFEIKGVLCYSSNPELQICAIKVATCLDLPHNSIEAVNLLEDKIEMRKMFNNLNFPIPKEYGPYVVVKERHSIGGSGVRILDAEYIVEEYVDGAHFHWDGWVQDSVVGSFATSGKTVKVTNGKPLTKGYRTHFMNEFLQETAQKIVETIGANNHLIGIDMIRDDKDYIIEFGILLDCRMDRLLSNADCDVYGALVDIVTGKWPQVSKVDIGHELKLLYGNNPQSVADTTGYKL